MKHYSRENEKNLAKIAELERRRDTCEAGLAALEACWTQVSHPLYHGGLNLTNIFSFSARYARSPNQNSYRTWMLAHMVGHS